MLSTPLAIAVAVALVIALFFVTRAGRPAAAVRREEGGRRPAFSVEAIGLLVLLVLLLAALWWAR